MATLLPNQRSTPKEKLSEYTIFTYGQVKVGKTTWASGFPNGLFLASEAGHNALSVFKVDITSWDVFLNVCTELAAGDHPFENVILDTIDNFWEMCRQYVCKKNKISHESEMSYGRGYALIMSEFARVLNKLAMLPLGLVIISHSQVIELQTRTGVRHKIVPSLKDKPRQLILGLSDIVAYCDLEMTTGANGEPEYRRVMRTQPNPNYEAGDRTGKLPDPLPLDFEAFEQAFNSAVGKDEKDGKEPQAAQTKPTAQPKQNPPSAKPNSRKDN